MKTTYKKGVYQITFEDGTKLLRVAKKQKDAKELFNLVGKVGLPINNLYMQAIPLGYGMPANTKFIQIVELEHLAHS